LVCVYVLRSFTVVYTFILVLVTRLLLHFVLPLHVLRSAFAIPRWFHFALFSFLFRLIRFVAFAFLDVRSLLVDLVCYAHVLDVWISTVRSRVPTYVPVHGVHFVCSVVGMDVLLTRSGCLCYSALHFRVCVRAFVCTFGVHRFAFAFYRFGRIVFFDVVFSFPFYTFHSFVVDISLRAFDYVCSFTRSAFLRLFAYSFSDVHISRFSLFRSFVFTLILHRHRADPFSTRLRIRNTRFFQVFVCVAFCCLRLRCRCFVRLVCLLRLHVSRGRFTFALFAFRRLPGLRLVARLRYVCGHFRYPTHTHFPSHTFCVCVTLPLRWLLRTLYLLHS